MNRRRGYHPNRWVRTSHCPHTGKVRYPTDHAAERDMRRIQTQVLAEGRTHVPQETYACTECDGWHLTSEKRRDRLGAERAPSRPGSRARRQRWRRTLTVQLLLAEPWCPVRTTGCTGRASTLIVTEGGKKTEYKFEMGLIAVGMTGNVEGFGLEKAGVQVEKGFIKVNEMYETSTKGIYAIGDVAGPPLLAHAASHEGVVAAEHLAGKHPHAIDKMNIAGCTYCQPQVASVGYTERALKEKGIEYNVGKAPFMANGKAIASNEKDGFIKVLTGKKHGELLGAHIVGTHATELIHEYVLFRTMEGIDEEIFATIHPHPTLGEFLGEAVMAAKGRALNL
jgi:hypothetical protein